MWPRDGFPLKCYDFRGCRYSDGDFLSTHNDGASGSLAWVFHLASEWDAASGGSLRFNAYSAFRGARDFQPGWNRMLLFLTRPNYTPHQVCATHLELVCAASATAHPALSMSLRLSLTEPPPGVVRRGAGATRDACSWQRAALWADWLVHDAWRCFQRFHEARERSDASCSLQSSRRRPMHVRRRACDVKRSENWKHLYRLRRCGGRVAVYSAANQSGERNRALTAERDKCSCIVICMRMTKLPCDFRRSRALNSELNC